MIFFLILFSTVYIVSRTILSLTLRRIDYMMPTVRNGLTSWKCVFRASGDFNVNNFLRQVQPWCACLGGGRGREDTR